MGNKKKHRQAKQTTRTRQRKKATSSDALLAEGRRADTITIGWTLAVMTALGAQIAAGVVAVIGALREEETVALTALLRLLIVSATIAGLLSLAMLPLVYAFRRDRPPLPIVAASLLIAAIPLVVVVWGLS